jgi:hypothetical protein
MLQQNKQLMYAWVSIFNLILWRKLLVIDMYITNLLDFTLKPSELEIRSDVTAQLVFHKQVLPPDILTWVTIGKYAT